MKLWRRMAPTIVWASVVGALFPTIFAVLATSAFSSRQATWQVTALAEIVHQSDFAERCAADPEGWSQTLSTGSRMTVFDLDHLPTGSRGPDARLLRRIQRGANQASRLLMFQEFGGVTLMRLAPDGPCSLMEIHWRADASSRIGLLLLSAVLAVLLALVTGASSTLWVVRPLIRRIQRLAAAATRAGEGEGGYRSAEDGSDDELGALSRVLDAADARIVSTTRKLEAQNTALQVHLADIAHDLKTPLTAVQLSLEEAARLESDGEAKNLITSGLNDCVYLAAMIDNLRVGVALRDGVGPDQGKTRVEVGEVVEQTVRRLGLLGRFKQVELNMARPEQEVWCACLPLVLERVVDNLVYNAVSHGRPGGHVAVILETVGDTFQLTVLDDGPGMRPDELSELGRRWFRGEGADVRAPRGTGLGTGIVQEACRRWGWTLSYAQEEPSGLRVTIQGPLTERPGAAA